MFSIRDNEVTFKKGAKPNSIKTLQRQVRDVYMDLVSARAPREDSIAKICALKIIKVAAQDIAQTAPQFMHAIDSGVRAYCRAGDGLAKFQTMYSMDVMIPVGELSLYPDVPNELKDQAREAGLTEIKFKAREG